VLVMAALSCTFYVACGDDDIIIGDPVGTAGRGGAGGRGGAAGRGGMGGAAGRGGTSGVGGLAGGGMGGTVVIPDAGSPDGGDSGPTSNG
jgi:hypothetical protein